jgi:flagellar assembly protein FliH
LYKQVVWNSAAVTPFESVLSTIPEGALVSRDLASERLEDMLERIREEAYHAGFKEGYEAGVTLGKAEGRRAGYMDGLAQAQEEMQEQVRGEAMVFANEVQQIRDELDVAIKQWFVRSEEALTDLSIEAVKRVLRAELSQSRESVKAIVKDALREITHANHARIRVNPSDSAYFLEHRDILFEAGSNLRDCEIVPDPTVAAGCIIETEAGIVDARLQVFENSLETNFRETA